MTSQGILPLLEKNVTRPDDADERSTGRRWRHPSAPSSRQEGRRIYIREGCWYCHSQYIRPVNRDTDKWGPVTPGRRDQRRPAADVRHAAHRSRSVARGRTAAPTSGTTLITGIRGRRNPSRSCRPSPGCTPTIHAHDAPVIAFLEKYDKNHDGRVTKSELDKNGDGVVTPDELPPDWKELDVWPVNPDGSRRRHHRHARLRPGSDARNGRPSRPTCRRSERRSATGAVGSRGRRTAGRRRPSRWPCARPAARPSSRRSAPAATASSATGG